MIINGILIGTYIVILLERSINKSLHHMFHILFHSFLIFVMLYIIFITLSKSENTDDFENNIVDRQLDKVIRELDETTIIRRKKAFPENKFGQHKTILTRTGIIIAVSIIIGLCLLFYVINKYTKSISYSHLRYYIFSISILTGVEVLFNYLIKQHTFKSRKENVISTNFLGNIEKYSDFVP